MKKESESNLKTSNNGKKNHSGEGKKPAGDDQVRRTPAELLEKCKHRVEVLEHELTEKDNRVQENMDLAKRVKANFDNYKKRVRKEQEEGEFFIKKHLFNRIFDVLDNFERAIISVETSADNDSLTSEMLVGIKLIYDQLLKILNDEGIGAIETVGTSFDPIKHDVVLIEEGEQYIDNQVIEELQKGYLQDMKVFRPAKVKVGRRKKTASE